MSDGFFDAAMDKDVKQQRDRFMALAFAVGDLLLEVDGNGTIRYAIGAGLSTVGVDTGELVGQSAAGLFAGSDRAVLRYLTTSVPEGHRRGPLQMDLPPGRGAAPVVVNAFRMPGPDRPLSIAVSGSEGAALHRMTGERDPVSGLLGLEAFTESVSAYIRRLGSARPPMAISFFHFDWESGAPDDEVLADLGAALRCQAFIDAAATVGTGRFGLVHASSTSADTIAEMLAAIVGGGEDGEPEAVTLAINPRLRVDEAVRAAIYGIHEFAARDSVAPDLSALATTLARRTTEVMRGDGALGRAIAGGDLQLVAMPIVSLDDHATARIELLVRQPAADAPENHHRFAEKLGAVYQFDLAMAGYAMAYIASTMGRKATRVGTNIMAESLLRDDVMAGLSDLLSAGPGDPGRLVFEVCIEESVINLDRLSDAFEVLKGLGAGVTLDRFGTSAASLHHLQGLAFDEIKFAGQWLRSAPRSPRNAALLEAMIGYASRLSIATTAMQVDSLALAANLAARGLSHGQGPAFGHPIPIDATRLTAVAATAGG
ncbi:MAG: EAL domain-containing protein [Hyphomicrobiales bacterium]